LRGANDRHLSVLDDVPSDEHTRDAARLVLSALDAAVTCELTAQRFGERRLPAGRRVEVQGRPCEASSAAKDDPAQLLAAAFEALDALLHDRDLVAPQMLPLRW